MAISIERREFITALGGAAVAWPLVARAQQSENLPTIGFLGAGSRTTWKDYLAAFEKRLRELGRIDGQTMTLVIRWAEGHRERYSEIAAEFVGLPVDVIVTPGSAGVAMKQATSTIPIVLSSASDPVGSGLVKSLSRPGGNVTGLSLQANELSGKRIEFLREVVPNLRRIGIMFNSGYPAAVLEMEQVETAARRLGVEAVRLVIHSAQEIAPTVDGIKDSNAGLYVCIDGLVNTDQVQINERALVAQIPTVVQRKRFCRERRLDILRAEHPGAIQSSSRIGR
jgi:putative tryptophan/tyrosine transport system substrate-binding protein